MKGTTLRQLRSVVVLAVGLSFIMTGPAAGKEGKFFKGKDAILESAVSADDRNAIAQALAGGAKVNARGKYDVTPLMLAVDALHKSAVIELLARGANPNLKAQDGHSAVSLAVENYKHSPEIFLAVMKAGGNPNIRRPDNDPVIMRFINDRNCSYIRQMKSFGADVNITTRGGDPIITDAGLAADWDVVWCLIELGAKYDHQRTAHLIPLNESLNDDFTAPDSPIYPYKKKVWHFLHDHGIKLKPLK